MARSAGAHRFTASNPRLLHPFEPWNAGKAYPDQVKPGNFLLIAHVAPGGHPAGTDPKHFLLVAPYNPDPDSWAQLPWRNLHDPDGPTYAVSGETLISRRGQPLPAGVVGVKTYRHVLEAYRVHPEPKSLDREGTPCGRESIGQLARRPVQADTVTHIGKEVNLLDELAAGLVTDEDEVVNEYAPTDQAAWATALDRLSPAEAAEKTGLHPSTIRRICTGQTRPRRDTQEALAQLAVTPTDADTDQSCPVCGKPIAARRARYCSNACRQRAYRARRRSHGECSASQLSAHEPEESV